MSLLHLSPIASLTRAAVISTPTKSARGILSPYPNIQTVLFLNVIPFGVADVDIATVPYCPITSGNHGSYIYAAEWYYDPTQPDWPWYGWGNTGLMFDTPTQFAWPTGMNPDGSWMGTGGTQWFYVSRFPGVDGRGLFDDATCQAHALLPWQSGLSQKIKIKGPAKGTLLQYPETSYLSFGGDPLGGYYDYLSNPVAPSSAVYYELGVTDYLEILPTGGTSAATDPTDPDNPFTWTIAPTVFRLGKTPADFGF